MIDPIKLCCFYPASYHNGAQCPTGAVMCCICFEVVTPAELSKEDGQLVNVCKLCAVDELLAASRKS